MDIERNLFHIIDNRHHQTVPMIKQLNYIWLVSEALSIWAMIFVLIKVIALEPQCFSIFDNYVALLPLLLSKGSELLAIYAKKGEFRI